MLVDEGSTTIAVLDGVVTARIRRSVEIPTGDMAVVGTDGVVGPIQAIQPELLDGDWLTFNRCADHDTPACSEKATKRGPEGDGGGAGGQGDGPGGQGGGREGPTGPSNGPARGSRGRADPHHRRRR